MKRWRKFKAWFFHICVECGEPDRFLGFHVGHHRFEDDTCHIPF